jgi:hypothetical protein
MRQGPNGRRPRSRHHGGGGSGGGPRGGDGGNSIGNRPRSAASLRHQSFDSNCGDLRVRGNAWQVCEKYQALARDANSSGDRILAENYLQHAEHYFRIIEAIDEATAAEQRLHGDPNPNTGANAVFGGQQPEIPANYYTQAPVPVPGADPNNATAQPQSEATVQTRNPPVPQASPFFTQEEIDEHNQQQPVALAR